TKRSISTRIQLRRCCFKQLRSGNHEVGTHYRVESGKRGRRNFRGPDAFLLLQKLGGFRQTTCRRGSSILQIVADAAATTVCGLRSSFEWLASDSCSARM